MITARRVQFPEPNRAVLEAFQVGEPTGRDLLLEAEYSVISAGTEGAIFTGLELEHPGKNPAFEYPRATTGYGHLSRVIAAGPEASKFKPGDRVLSMAPHASHWLWDENRLTFKVPEDIPGERAVFVRMAGVGITALRKSSVQPGDTVAVIGLGLVGNFAAQCFLLAGAEVLGLDISDARLRQAKACGIRNVRSTRDADPAALVNDWTDGKGARIVVEAIGSPELIDRSVHCTRRHGEVILLGSPRKRVTMDVTPMLSRIHLTGINLIGALEWLYSVPETEFARFTVLENYRQIAGWIQDDRIVVDPLRTHVLSPAECQRAYDGLIHDRDVYAGVVFDWSQVGSSLENNHAIPGTQPGEQPSLR
jgi:2-desacetyl-2-hydroxyethyl bacteriochlorophyllide A dehydrogenase